MANCHKLKKGRVKGVMKLYNGQIPTVEERYRSLDEAMQSPYVNPDEVELKINFYGVFANIGEESYRELHVSFFQCYPC